MSYVNLSEGEWKIMKVLWKSAPRTGGEISSELFEETEWSRATVFVMLKRLLAKGAVRLDDGGRYQHYYPAVEREECRDNETDSFISRVFDGNVGLLVTNLAGRKKLSEEDIAELKKLIVEAEKELK